MTDQQLRTRLEHDTARPLTVIARIAPAAGLSPANTTRIDQVAANATQTAATDQTQR